AGGAGEAVEAEVLGLEGGVMLVVPAGRRRVVGGRSLGGAAGADQRGNQGEGGGSGTDHGLSLFPWCGGPDDVSAILAGACRVRLVCWSIHGAMQGILRAPPPKRRPGSGRKIVIGHCRPQHLSAGWRRSKCCPRKS